MKNHLGWYYVKWQKVNDLCNGEFIIDPSVDKSQLPCCSTQPLFREVLYWGKNIQHLQRDIDFFQFTQFDLGNTNGEGVHGQMHKEFIC